MLILLLDAGGYDIRNFNQFFQKPFYFFFISLIRIPPKADEFCEGSNFCFILDSLPTGRQARLTTFARNDNV